VRAWRNNISLKQMEGVRDALAAKLDDAGELVLTDSNRRVPEDTGDLKRSGKVQRVGPEKVAVTYTDSGAVSAHEKLNVPPANGRERKYLETAFNTQREAVLRLLVAEARRSLGS
jgi:hypothetical protein